MASATGEVNVDLKNERNKATFEPIQLTNLLYGGLKNVTRKRYIQSLALNDTAIKNSPSWADLSADERHAEALRKSIHCANRIKELGLTNPVDKHMYMSACMPNENSPFGLHNSMFTDVITNQASDEQKEKWLPLVENYQILGTYAQTELGHGTFIRGLETRATFDVKMQEFVLNSPTITSIKFWPGALGKTSNYCLVMAQLYSQGRCHGLQSFLVPLRSLDDHQPLPGIEVGDIGTKFGYDSIDNGYLRMTNVRIPWENMLMRYSMVSKDGTFVKPKHDKLLYGGMVMIRTFITGDVGRGLSMACTIAIRYSAVRHQTETVAGEGENQILDYQTQQYKLFPALCTSLAYLFAGLAIRDIYMKVMSQIRKGFVEELPQLHALTAGLKACSSATCTNMMETCRKACGGHGYSQASGFPKIYVNLTPACTYEGENTVLLLQTARYLIKCLTTAKQGQELPTLMSYLKRPIDGRTSTINDQLDFNSLIEAFEYRASSLIQTCGRRLQNLTSSGKNSVEAWSLTTVQLVKAAQAHVECYVVKTFVQNAKKDLNKPFQSVLQALCRLYCVYNIINNLGEFMQNGFINGDQVEMLNNRLLDLLAEIRPNAVTIVDGFDFPDQILDSALGRYDGQVYQALYDYARNSKRNKTEVTDAYYKYLKPFLDAQKHRSTTNSSVLASRL